MFADPPPNEILCPICLDVMKDAVITPYGHSYCHQCVSRYVQSSGACPLTRRPLVESQLTPNLLARTIVDELDVFCPHGLKFGERWLLGHPPLEPPPLLPPADPSARRWPRRWPPPPGLAAGESGAWEQDLDGCLDKVKFGLRRAHLQGCPHASVECPYGGRKCGPVVRMDLDMHVDEECQFSGRSAADEAREGRERARATLYSLAASSAVSLLVVAALLHTQVVGNLSGKAAWAILGLLSLPVGLVVAAVYLEQRLADEAVSAKLD